MERKKETFIFNGLGFPIQLKECPMKKVVGEWVIDINLNALQLLVFKELIHKPSSLTGREIRFMRKFMDLTTEELGKMLGVTHAAVVKWEKEQSKMSQVQEIYIRMRLSSMLMDREINAIFKDITPETLTEARESNKPLSINASDLLEDAV